MDEMSNKSGSAPLENQEPIKSSNGEQPMGKTPLAPRAITSKRVVIPQNAKRSSQTKPSEPKPTSVSSPYAPVVERAPETDPVESVTREDIPTDHNISATILPPPAVVDPEAPTTT